MSENRRPGGDFFDSHWGCV